jgi:hypothetical protein
MLVANGSMALLNYFATHPAAVIRYNASDMVLHIHSDATYLSASQARSRIGGFFLLRAKTGDKQTPPSPSKSPPFNRPVLVNSTILKLLMASARKAELGAVFYNAKDGAMLRTILEELSPTDNTDSDRQHLCFWHCDDAAKQCRSKVIDMHFYWIRDFIKNRGFMVYRRKGNENDADSFTKHHSLSHHCPPRPRSLHTRQVTPRVLAPASPGRPAGVAPSESECAHASLNRARSPADLLDST